jgi:hypothetical protein
MPKPIWSQLKTFSLETVEEKYWFHIAIMNETSNKKLWSKIEALQKTTVA